MHQRRLWGSALAVAWVVASSGLTILTGCAEAADESASAVVVVEEAEGWEETAGLQLVVDGEIDPGARIFDAPDFQHTLVVPTAGSSYLLALKAQEVLAFGSEGVAWTAARLPVPDPAFAENVGMFFNDAGLLQFDTDTASYIVQPEPPLVGAMTLLKLREAKADYAILADEFAPDAGVLAKLAASPGAEVKVFFGTWCSYCKHWLPPFMKTMAEAGDKFSAEYYGVSEDMSEPADELSRYDISTTPTFVVFQDGKEIGRIEEEPLESMEADLLHILTN